MHSTPLPSIDNFETSYISFDDHFAALQIELCVRGWSEGFGRNRRLHHSHQSPNYVRSIKRDSAPSPKERRLLYSFPSAKTSGAEAFRPSSEPQPLCQRTHFRKSSFLKTGRIIAPTTIKSNRKVSNFRTAPFIHTFNGRRPMLKLGGVNGDRRLPPNAKSFTCV